MAKADSDTSNRASANYEIENEAAGLAKKASRVSPLQISKGNTSFKTLHLLIVAQYLASAR